MCQKKERNTEGKNDVEKLGFIIFFFFLEKTGSLCSLLNNLLIFSDDINKKICETIAGAGTRFICKNLKKGFL